MSIYCIAGYLIRLAKSHTVLNYRVRNLVVITTG